MHHTAEFGIAAHWKYKLGINGTAKFEERLSWIRQLLESQSETEDVEDIVSTIKSDLVPEEVFVFTPKGDVFSLPSGATVIDFAYAIHSAVGKVCVKMSRHHSDSVFNSFIYSTLYPLNRREYCRMMSNN